MRQQFCVIYRDMDDNIETVICDSFREACVTQLAMVRGITTEEAIPMLEPRDAYLIRSCLEEYGRAHRTSEKAEAFIFLLPKKDTLP